MTLGDFCLPEGVWPGWDSLQEVNGVMLLLLSVTATDLITDTDLLPCPGRAGGVPSPLHRGAAQPEAPGLARSVAGAAALGLCRRESRVLRAQPHLLLPTAFCTVSTSNTCSSTSPSLPFQRKMPWSVAPNLQAPARRPDVLNVLALKQCKSTS